MPFQEDYNNPWEFSITPAAEANGLLPFRADDRRLAGGIITKDITRSIMEAEVIVAEMSGQNPNVLYELGLAHAAKKKVIMITQNEKDIPFDIKSIRYIEYNKNNLSALRTKLENAMRVLLESCENDDRHDFFPELEILTQEKKKSIDLIKRENAELASLAHGVNVNVKPSFAYIFFNNRYLGISPQIIHVNPYNEHNVITVYAIGHFEEYHVVSDEDVSEHKIDIVLSTRDSAKFPERVHKWLNYIRLRPDDIVIGFGLYQYLSLIGKYEDAMKEIQGLLAISQWSMIYNGIGWLYTVRGNHEKAIEFYNIVKRQEATYIGPYNLACAYSRMEAYEKCLVELKEIFESKTYIDQLIQTSVVPRGGNSLLLEDAFDNIKSSPVYSSRFLEFANRLNVEIASRQTIAVKGK